MGVFEHFPYTNFHDLNLDWIIKELEKLSTDVRDFISINAIKYANPIQWDITSQYEKNTVVLDKDGNAYLSVQPVPAGVSLDRAEYWTNIGNFSALWESVKQAITIPDEGHETTASAPRAVNDLVWVNGKLLEVLQPMIAGDRYIVGSNCRIYSMQIMLTELLDSLEQLETEIQAEQTVREEAVRNEQTAREAADTALEKKIAGTINVATYNPTADGMLHMLSERFETLEEAQASFPAAETLTDTIDWAAIQSALNKASNTGNSVHIPAGNYVVNKTLNADFTNKRYNIRGIGGCDDVNISTPSTLDVVMNLHGKTTPPYTEATNAVKITLENIKLTGYNKSGTGLIVQYISFFEIDNVYCTNFQYGMKMDNTDHAILKRVSTRWNVYGIYAGSQDFIHYTGINNITCLACIFGNNTTYGAEFFNCANITFIGCSFEYNGQSSGNRTDAGLIAYKCQGQGATGINVISCYMEGNKGFADITIDQQFSTDADFNGTCNIIGCTFNLNAQSNTQSCIYLLGNSLNTTKVNVIGCGAKSYTGWTPTSNFKFLLCANQNTHDSFRLIGNSIIMADSEPSFDIQFSNKAWAIVNVDGTTTANTDIGTTAGSIPQGITIGDHSITIQQRGFVLLTGTLNLSSNTTFKILKNDSTIYNFTGATAISVNLSSILQCESGDIITFQTADAVTINGSRIDIVSV